MLFDDIAYEGRERWIRLWGCRLEWLSRGFANQSRKFEYRTLDWKERQPIYFGWMHCNHFRLKKWINLINLWKLTGDCLTLHVDSIDKIKLPDKKATFKMAEVLKTPVKRKSNEEKVERTPKKIWESWRLNWIPQFIGIICWLAIIVDFIC